MLMEGKIKAKRGEENLFLVLPTLFIRSVFGIPENQSGRKLSSNVELMRNATLWLCYQYLFLVLIGCLLLVERAGGDARAQTIKIMCGNQLEHNSSIFVPNFVNTMENIRQQMRRSGFGVAVTGTGPDTNYGLSQCYGDLTSLDCVLCYAEARTILPQCYPYNSGRTFLDGCFMRFENYSFFEEYKGNGDTAVCGNVTRKNSTFAASARQAVMQAAAAAPINGGYARIELAVSGNVNESTYVLADCWKTLNASACQACLQNASALVTGCLPWSEGRVLNTGCFMRYSDQNFLNRVPESGRSRVTVIVIVVSVVSSLVVLAVGVIVGIYIWKRKYIKKKRRGHDARRQGETLHDSSLNFKYSTLEKATGSFDDANMLGQGGFGTVYKGVLPDGREIAVKRLFFNNRQRVADFYNEVNIISRMEHKNLVRLLGCSCSGPESLLVYEYLPNKSLDHFIFDENKGKALNWGKRLEIIIGTAEGLVYLHENSKIRIIHRDIKAGNILVDSKLRAKIADFGLVRSFQDDKSHISTGIAGTLGYMAPEYLSHGQLTEKVDVYSFGVVLLEIITGRQNNRSVNGLVALAWNHFQTGTVEELSDPNYHDSNVKMEIFRVVQIGLLCTQKIPSLRPTMLEALQMLTTEEILPMPSKCEDPKIPNYPLNAGASASVASVSHSSFYPR